MIGWEEERKKGGMKLIQPLAGWMDGCHSRIGEEYIFERENCINWPISPLKYKLFQVQLLHTIQI